MRKTIRTAWPGLVILPLAVLQFGAAPALAQEAGARLKARFLDHVTTELDLDREQREALEEIFDRTIERRRQLARDGLALRGRIRDALSRPTTPDETFRELTEALIQQRIREAESLSWQREELARILTPRQTLRFILMQQRVARRVENALRNRGRR